MNALEALWKAMKIHRDLVAEQRKINEAVAGAEADIEKLNESHASGVVTWDVLNIIEQLEAL